MIDSPITESGFCGLTVGAALAGLHPVVGLHDIHNYILDQTDLRSPFLSANS